MKKNHTKKIAPTASRKKKTVKDLDVKLAKGGTVRGGLYSEKTGGGGGTSGGGTGGGGTGYPKF